jgi:hypothetical protein
MLKSHVRFQKDVDPKVLQRAGQKGWKKVHYWLHVVCSQSSHRMNAKYYYYNVATLLLHRRWSLDRRSFSSSTPPALESRVDISKAHWGQKRLEIVFEFLWTGWLNNWTRAHFALFEQSCFLCVNIFYSETWAKIDMDQLSSLSCPHGFDQPSPIIYNFTSYWQIFQDFTCRLIVWEK